MSGEGTAKLSLTRPRAPITSTQLEEALAPLLELLNARSEDVETIHIRRASIRLQVVPVARGRRQHDARVGVTYPIVYEPEDGGRKPNAS